MHNPDNISSNFTSYQITESYYNVIKINLKRAVIDYVQDFKDYISTNQNLSNNNLILDFSSTNFIDSSFLGSIISLLKKIKISKGSLSLVIDRGKITFFIPVKNISKVINIYPSVDEAVDNLNRYTTTNPQTSF